MPSLDCPRCRAALAARSFTPEGTAMIVDLCERGCGGVWLDAGDLGHGRELVETLAEVTAPPASIDRTPLVACPVCRSTMRRYRWNYTSPVVLDQCPDGHGTWLDGGEADEMQAVQADETLPPAERARLRARLAIDRLDGLTRARRADHADRLPHPIVRLLHHVYAVVDE